MTAMTAQLPEPKHPFARPRASAEALLRLHVWQSEAKSEAKTSQEAKSEAKAPDGCSTWCLAPLGSKGGRYVRYG